MPVSRLNSDRRAKARKYGAKDAAYQFKLAQYCEEKALGYLYPRYAPRGGNGDREYRRTARNFGRPTLFLPYATPPLSARRRHAAPLNSARRRVPRRTC